MNRINWDKLQRQHDELNPNCPWTDDEDELSQLEKDEIRTDEEED